MSNYNPGFRQDRRQVVRKTGASAGAWFWGILAAVIVLFWPSIYHCATGVAAAWYGMIVILGLGLLLGAVNVRMTRPPMPPPVQPIPDLPPVPRQPQVPDLRESGTFEGKW